MLLHCIQLIVLLTTAHNQKLGFLSNTASSGLALADALNHMFWNDKAQSYTASLLSTTRSQHGFEGPCK